MIAAAQQAKAVASFLVGLLGVIATVVASLPDGVPSWVPIVIAGATAVLSYVATYRVPNADHSDADVRDVPPADEDDVEVGPVTGADPG